LAAKDGLICMAAQGYPQLGVDHAVVAIEIDRPGSHGHPDGSPSISASICSSASRLRGAASFSGVWLKTYSLTGFGSMGAEGIEPTYGEL